MITPSPKLDDTYPPEILAYPPLQSIQPEALSEHEKRAVEILCDDDVRRVAKRVIADLLADNKHWQGEDNSARLDGFLRFIEEAAALPDRQPPGSHLCGPEEVPAFSTDSVLREEISEAQSTSLRLKGLLRRIATTIDAELPVKESRRLMDSLDALHSACAATAHKHASNKQFDGVPDFPLPGGTAGKNAWRNWLLQELNLLAGLCLRAPHVAHARAPYRALVIEVHRVVVGADEPINPSTARSNLGDAGNSVWL